MKTDPADYQDTENNDCAKWDDENKEHVHHQDECLVPILLSPGPER